LKLSELESKEGLFAAIKTETNTTVWVKALAPFDFRLPVTQNLFISVKLLLEF